MQTLSVFLVVLMTIAAANFDIRNAPPQSPAQSAAFQKVEDDLIAQFLEMQQAYLSGDAQRGKDLLNKFCLPSPEEWLEKNLGKDGGPKMADRYRERCETFKSYWDNTFREMLRWKHFTVKSVIEWEPPPWPAQTQENVKAIPNAPKPLAPTFAFRMLVVDDKVGGIFSNEECFVYQDGAYRLIGIGTYPFWVWEVGAEPTLDPRGAFLALPRTVLIVRHSVNPTYPEAAREQGIRGCAIVDFEIDADGKIAQTTPVSGNPLLAEAVMKAVRTWGFVPGSAGGKYVQTKLTIRHAFGVPNCRQP